MKPSWDQAPEWAHWLAMDKNGEWYWHKDKPTPLANVWHTSSRQFQIAGVLPKWTETLEERPE